VHQLQPSLAQQVPDALLQRADDVSQWQHHLDVGVLFGGQPAELLDCSLLLKSGIVFSSDSLLFLGRKIDRRPIMAGGLRVATFYGLPGILPGRICPMNVADGGVAYSEWFATNLLTADTIRMALPRSRPCREAAFGY
jgi:hypothetical protein